MATIFADRAQFMIGGAPASAFNVGQSGIQSISVRYTFQQNPVNGLSATPSYTGVIPSAKIIYLAFEYAFTNKALMFDFSALPTDITNVQCLLFGETGTPLAILGRLYFVGDNLAFPDQATYARRAIVFGALDINYFGL